DEVLPFHVAHVVQAAAKCIKACRILGHRRRLQHAEPPNLARWLRAYLRREHHRGAKNGDELAAPHSITLSARSTSPTGTSCPIALAVLRLMTSSNLVGCSMGRSAGLPPRKTLTTNRAI